MKIKTLNIPNTKINHDKVANTVAAHMVEKCLTEQEIKNLAIQYLEDTYHEANHTIGFMAQMVKDTPADAGCRIPQSQEALYYGSSSLVDDDGGYYFYTRSFEPDYSSLEVKETTKEAL